jgi:hypothetical protein
MHSFQFDAQELERIDLSYRKIGVAFDPYKAAFADHWSASDTGSGTVTPTDAPAQPFHFTDDAVGSSVQHLVPTLPLAAPTAQAPVNTIFTTTPTFSWTAVTGATHYFVVIVDLDVPLVVHAAVAGNSLVLGFPLTPGHTYQWYVEALDDQGDASPLSNALDFAVAFGSM